MHLAAKYDGGFSLTGWVQLDESNGDTRLAYRVSEGSYTALSFGNGAEV